MKNHNQRYTTFVQSLRTIQGIEHALALLMWDQQVYMPHQAAEGRAEQIGTLSAIKHEKITHPQFVEQINELLVSDATSADQRLNLERAWREIGRELTIPFQLAQDIARQSAHTYNLWIEAWTNNNFSIVSKDLDTLVRLKRDYADRVLSNESKDYTVSPKYQSRYDVLLGIYEPGMSSSQLEPMLTQLGTQLQELLQRILANHSKCNDGNLDLASSKDKQRQLFYRVAEQFGFDFSSGRLDETVHPFCSTIGRSDVRLCTHYDESNFVTGLLGLIHEAGHGMYEQGLPDESWGLPLGEACSLGIHESQSLLWEKHIGRSREFWDYFCSIASARGETDMQRYTAEELYRHINKVHPTLIRIHADEITYHLHIIIRCQIERDLIEGKLNVNDLPETWNDSYSKLLNIHPPDDLAGVLQDIHWYSGMFGYFPTYTLGAIFAAQLFEAFLNENASSLTQFRTGDFSSLKAWLAKNVFCHGKRYDSAELVEQVTNRPVAIDALMQHLTKRYSEIYGLSA